MTSDKSDTRFCRRLPLLSYHHDILHHIGSRTSNRYTSGHLSQQNHRNNLIDPNDSSFHLASRELQRCVITISTSKSEFNILRRTLLYRRARPNTNTNYVKHQQVTNLSIVGNLMCAAIIFDIKKDIWLVGHTWIQRSISANPCNRSERSSAQHNMPVPSIIACFVRWGLFLCCCLVGCGEAFGFSNSDSIRHLPSSYRFTSRSFLLEFCRATLCSKHTVRFN